jgi:ABC-2 type transport system permease protein
MCMLDLIRKDITQILRDWKSALFLVIMPILFTVFFGLIFGAAFSNNKSTSDPRLPVGFVNEDPGGLLSASLEALLPSSDVIRPVVLNREQAANGNELVSKGEVSAVFRVPTGYSLAILSGQGMSLDVIADQSTAVGKTCVTALDTITGRMFGALESARISVQAYQERAGFTDEASRLTYFEDAFKQAVSAWGSPALSVNVQKATGQANITQENSGFTQSSAGMIVQFAVFGLISSGMILVLERKNGAMPRLLTAPVSRVEIIAGHTLAMFLVVFAQELLLVILGQFLFKVNYLRQPAAILLMMITLALFAASLGLLISAISRREEQVIVLCLIAMFIFSALGGAWFPLEVTGKAFSAIGHVLPSAWAMDGFQNIIVRGLGFSSVLLPAGLLLGYTLVFFALAIWRFKFS